jgi:chromate transporter
MELLRLALVCLRIGAVVFGGGMVMVPLLEADAVYRYHWLTQKQFVDAVALGQMTPGPLLVSATFIGYAVGAKHDTLHGLLYATVATVCMFLPSFLMTVLASYRLARLQKNVYVKGFLQGVMAAVVGLVAAAAVSIARQSCAEVGTALLAAAALVALLKFKADASLVVVGCGLVGLLLWH